MTTAYARGANFERRAKARLEENLYLVFRVAGSRTKADLVAFGNGHVLLVQCKSGQRSCSKREQRELIDLAEDVQRRSRADVHPVVCERGLRFRWLDLAEEAVA